jgi:hypothetical protein
MRIQRRDRSGKSLANFQDLEERARLTEEAADSLLAQRDGVLVRFDDLLAPIMSTFERMHGPKLLASASAESTGAKSSVVRDAEPSSDPMPQATSFEIPAMLLDATVLQSMRAGITHNNLQHVSRGCRVCLCVRARTCV